VEALAAVYGVRNKNNLKMQYIGKAGFLIVTVTNGLPPNLLRWRWRKNRCPSDGGGAKTNKYILN
jgi:hypothetical protein